MKTLFHARSRARRTLLWLAAALLFSPVPGSLLVDCCPLPVRFSEAAAILKQWRENRPRPDVILFGSSKTYTFIQPELLTAEAQRLTGDKSLRVLGASVPAGEPLAMEYLAAKLFAAEPPPPLVILEASPEFTARSAPFFDYVIRRQMVAADLPRYLPEIYSTSKVMLRRMASSRLLPFFHHRSTLMAWAADAVPFTFKTAAPAETFLENPSPDAPVPAAPVQPAASLDINTPANAMLLRNLAKVMRLNKLAGMRSGAFERTVAMLRERGSVVVLVQMPLSEPYRTKFTPEMNAQYGAWLAALQKKYGCISAKFTDRLPDASFSDVYHGNAAGMREFTAILAREVVAPEWTRLRKNENPGAR